jgi:hypothetical protein
MFFIDAAAILLFFIWLALVSCSPHPFPSLLRSLSVQGVVVKPALAIPYFTGVAAFIGNIIFLTKSIQKWQDTIVNRVLEELEPLLDRFKPNLIDALNVIIDQIETAQEQINSASAQLSALNPALQTSALASISNTQMLINILKKLTDLRDSIENNDITGVASNLDEMKADATSAVRAVKGASGGGSGRRTAEKGISMLKDRAEQGMSAIQDKSKAMVLPFRKLSESEIIPLLRSLWTSIRSLRFAACTASCVLFFSFFIHREELGLSARNIIIALLSSSFILGLFLLFIFIGIGVFSDGSDPFAAIVNAGLALSAGVGNFFVQFFCSAMHALTTLIILCYTR